MRLKEVTYCGAMVAVIALLGIIPPFPLPGLPVPISLQTTGIMLAGSLLGKKLGTISVLIFLLMVSLGLPLLTGFRGGFAVFLGPTAGYLFSWPICAFLIGWLVEKLPITAVFWRFLVANLLGGMVVMNLIGLLGLVLLQNLPLAHAFWGSLIFYPGDALKAVVVAMVTQQLAGRIKL
ncbi:biotin transporter BioY [Fructilactobacillus florum]|uniref:biotin transporter BioY n=1 Tax=Fructilactobacillus florum TaxID=640331 RepID=UPI00028D14F6|nr:biotin transporter BioY [Fructilactobacillus florum]EKK21045.1 Substrate-specific component BioY of biotin ECF transporter [Fructilactobacillus florum 2F]